MNSRRCENSVISRQDGNVKEVKALNEPGDGLGKEAERVIKVCKYCGFLPGKTGAV